MFGRKVKQEEAQMKQDYIEFFQKRVDEGNFAVKESIEGVWGVAKTYARARETVSWLIVVMFIAMITFQYFNRTVIINLLEENHENIVSIQSQIESKCTQK